LKQKQTFNSELGQTEDLNNSIGYQTEGKNERIVYAIISINFYFWQFIFH
jgi:hypothetical protein